MTVIGPLNTVQAATGTVTLASSGLDHKDPLTTTIDTAYWKFNGSAGRELNARFSYSEDSQGLHIGVQSGSPGTFAGFFAISPNTTASLYHAFVTLSYPSMSTGETFNTGIYVQTWDPNSINYVGCVVQSTSSGYFWVVAQATGFVQGIVALQVTILYQSQTYPPTDTTHLNQDCTIITNGSNYLKVYIGGAVVVNRKDLNLNMASPFNAYLEPQSTSATSMHFGTYTNYYSTFGENVTVSNAPPGGTVQLVDTSNTVFATAPITSTGTAVLPVGKYHLPLTASVNVCDSANNLVASTSGPITIWGGNKYTASPTTTPSSTCSPSPAGQSTINVNTVNSVGVPLSGMFTTLWQNGVQIASCFSPCGFTVTNGQTYQVAVADFGMETFSHWSDGTTTRFHTVSVPPLSTTITLTAVYSP